MKFPSVGALTEFLASFACIVAVVIQLGFNLRFSPMIHRLRYCLNICSLIFVELTNTVFVNSTNITTNIETAVLASDRLLIRWQIN